MSNCRYHFPTSLLLGQARAAHPVKWADFAAVKAEVDRQVRLSFCLACLGVGLLVLLFGVCADGWRGRGEGHLPDEANKWGGPPDAVRMPLINMPFACHC